MIKWRKVSSILGLVVLGLLLIPLISLASPLTLDKFVDLIQKQYDQNRNLSGNFTQISYLKQHNRKTVSKGKVYLKRPDRMRWEYKKPEEQFIISDGKTIWLYIPLDRQVIKRRLNDAILPDSPYNFLMGRGDIRQLFDISFVTSEWGNKKLSYLSLVPKRETLNVAKIIIGVNGETFQVEETNIIDYFGNSIRVIISEADRESMLSNEIFNFVPPDDVEVIENNRG